ncbi:alpha/beta hydrolase family protein [Intestinirhabdus alba]|jgi:dienelactone hydrolase|uniref:Alpha/beta fold hydrolase n=1 Tax=Intestinirhabdus alba TaxID=2899544 RepID=A0A6L6IKB6_9ENTR|nr:alpha/beta fold hydrolase [Intestinirhabdus alba]MTH46016.1 alpha/beta fold hydrolase [Intestinirhabdus alba]
MIKYAVTFLATTIVLMLFLLSRLSDFDFGDARQRIISFEHHQNVLEGTLLLPPGKTSPPFVLLIHGDGPQDRWSEEGYIPLVNHLLSRGIAVFSWDKPGVGKSSGNWLAQTMSDRAEEAAFALQKLREQPELQNSRGGYLGFSQAGWVVPRASQEAPVDFLILVGAAINWRNQGIYYTGQRLKAEGHTGAAIVQAKRREAEAFDRQFTAEAAALPCRSRCTRQDFERRNSRADATRDITALHTPVLILMGGDDRNVDPDETIAVWSSMLPADTHRCIRRIEGATHGLLRSAWFDYQQAAQWPWWKQGLFVLSGKHAWSPGALNILSSWIVNQACGE